MDFFKPDAISSATGLLLPGVVAMLVYDLLVPSERRDWSKHSVAAASFGAGNYLLLKPLFAWLSQREIAISRAGLLTLAVTLLAHFVAPVLWAYLAFHGRRALASRGVVKLHPTPTAWDYFFSRQQAGWLKVRLCDGSQVAGRWSFAGSHVTKRDLHLVDARRVGDDGLICDGAGTPQELLIHEDQIGIIEFYPDPPRDKEKQNGFQESTATNSQSVLQAGSESDSRGLHDDQHRSEPAPAESAFSTTSTQEKEGVIGVRPKDPSTQE